MGDFHVGFKNSEVKAMVVVEPYQEEQTISKEKVEKFINDLDKNSKVHCGILLTMKNRFATMYQEYKVNY